MRCSNVHLAGLVIAIAMCGLLFMFLRAHPPPAHHEDWRGVLEPR